MPHAAHRRAVATSEQRGPRKLGRGALLGFHLAFGRDGRWTGWLGQRRELQMWHGWRLRVPLGLQLRDRDEFSVLHAANLRVPVQRLAVCVKEICHSGGVWGETVELPAVGARLTPPAMTR